MLIHGYYFDLATIFDQVPYHVQATPDFATSSHQMALTPI